MAMPTYAGQATLTLPSGHEILVDVSLASWQDRMPEPDWGGTIAVQLPASIYEAFGVIAKIRFDSGEVGDVSIVSFQPSPSGEIVRVTGSGPWPS